jgi:hypothetical protein
MTADDQKALELTIADLRALRDEEPEAFRELGQTLMFIAVERAGTLGPMYLALWKVLYVLTHEDGRT